LYHIAQERLKELEILRAIAATVCREAVAIGRDFSLNMPPPGILIFFGMNRHFRG